MAVAIPFIGLAISAAATAHSVHQGREQAREAKDDARDFENQQMAFQQELQQKQSQQESEQSQQAATAMNRQRAIASGYQRASQTTFTSPLGLPGGASTTRGTLLGL